MSIRDTRCRLCVSDPNRPLQGKRAPYDRGWPPIGPTPVTEPPDAPPRGRPVAQIPLGFGGKFCYV